jgi:hypothetical protein
MSNESAPPPRYGTRVNPRTGLTETYELPSPVDLPKARKGLADVLHGGQWFDGPLAAKPDPLPVPDVYIGDESTWGRAIEAIRQGR